MEIAWKEAAAAMRSLSGPWTFWHNDRQIETWKEEDPAAASIVDGHAKGRSGGGGGVKDGCLASGFLAKDSTDGHKERSDEMAPPSAPPL
jgi:hypothetical protein